jgi:hypothetical protein
MRDTGIWMRFCLTCLVLPLGAQVIAQPTVWDFESDRGDWRPRSATMIVERVADFDAAVDGRACLHVRGSMSENWNYALSETVPLQAGRLYRLSAWVKVTSAGFNTLMPFLKCEFVAADRNREMGRAATDAFDAARLGQWQQLTGEFRAPAGTVACWIALEKGTSDPTQIDAYLDNVVLEPIEQLTALSTYDLNPLPPALEKVRNTHPLCLSSGHRTALRQPNSA